MVDIFRFCSHTKLATNKSMSAQTVVTPAITLYLLSMFSFTVTCIMLCFCLMCSRCKKPFEDPFELVYKSSSHRNNHSKPNPKCSRVSMSHLCTDMINSAKSF